MLTLAVVKCCTAANDRASCLYLGCRCCDAVALGHANLSAVAGNEFLAQTETTCRLPAIGDAATVEDAKRTTVAPHNRRIPQEYTPMWEEKRGFRAIS